MQKKAMGRRLEWKFLGSLLALAIALEARPALAEPPPDQLFAQAKEHLNAGRLREAAAGFRSLALKRPPSALGESAALLYFDAASRALTEGTGAGLVNEATGTAVELMDIHCPEKRAPSSSQVCETLPAIHADLLRLQAETRSKAANKGGPDAAAAAQEAGDLYFSIWKFYGEGAKKGRPPYMRMDEVLYNAGVIYKLAGNVPASLRAFRLLVDLDNKMRSSLLAARATLSIGSILVSIGEYTEGAQWLERFARESPKEPGAPDALRDAIVLRLGLGLTGEAEAAAGLFSKNYGAKKPADAAEIAFAVAAWYGDHENYKGAEERLRASQAFIDRSGPLAVRIQARALLARSLAAKGDTRGAEEHYRAVQMFFKDPHVIAERIRNESPEPFERRLGRALTALGEAHFFFAEREREKVSAIKLPAYRGPADRETLKKSLPEALQSRKRAIEQADSAYVRVASIEPSPPPKWVIESAAQVAGMWADLVKDLRVIASAIKKESAGHKAPGDIQEAIEPFFKSALAAAKTCDRYSIKFQYASEASRRCQAWLIENAPRETPKIDELAPRIGYVRQGTEVEAPLLRPGDAAPPP
jgi:tetratricopeptide (TPR) repeat protein